MLMPISAYLLGETLWLDVDHHTWEWLDRADLAEYRHRLLVLMQKPVPVYNQEPLTMLLTAKMIEELNK